jgi:hypothetical protein
VTPAEHRARAEELLAPYAHPDSVFPGDREALLAAVAHALLAQAPAVAAPVIADARGFGVYLDGDGDGWAVSGDVAYSLWGGAREVKKVKDVEANYGPLRPWMPS